MSRLEEHFKQGGRVKLLYVFGVHVEKRKLTSFTAIAFRHC